MARSYAQLCGIASALDVMGDRWAPLIMRDLLLGPMRFSDLAGGLPGIGTNTLTARLKHLEEAGAVRRRLLTPPDGAVVYELTDYGREIEPVLMELGRWGAKSMGRLPADVATRSRWLAAAMLAFHDESHGPARPTTWELRMTDGTFTVHADGGSLTVAAGAPGSADAVVTVGDRELHALLTRRISPTKALRSGAVKLEGDRGALPALLDLFAFPALAAGD